MAAKLAVVTAERRGVSREAVRVRLVAHHSTERIAFGSFGALAGDGGPTGPPPLRVAVSVDGHALDAEEARELLTTAYPLLAGRETHALTAAATGATVRAMLADEPQRLHVPSPGGLPGGYPVQISRAGIALDLPPGLTETDAIAVNAVAARWDGIERIEPTGAFVYCDWLTAAAERAIGVRLERVEPDELETVAEQLAEALSAPSS
jgi:hypothetical protein